MCKIIYLKYMLKDYEGFFNEFFRNGLKILEISKRKLLEKRKPNGD